MTRQEIALVVLGAVVALLILVAVILWMVCGSLASEVLELRQTLDQERLGDARFGHNAPIEPPYQIVTPEDVYRRGVMFCARCNVVVNPYDPQCHCSLDGVES